MTNFDKGWCLPKKKWGIPSFCTSSSHTNGSKPFVCMSRPACWNIKCKCWLKWSNLDYLSEFKNIEIISLKVRYSKFYIFTQLHNTFFRGHFLLVRCIPYTLNPVIVSDDLYHSWNWSSITGQLGKVPKVANNPVEVTLRTTSAYSSQSSGITSLLDTSW